MKVGELAGILGGRVVGDSGIEIKGISTLEDAAEGDLSFLSNPKYKPLVYTTKASAIITSSESIKDSGKTLIVVDDPYLAFAKSLELFCPEPLPGPGIHPTAVVECDATIGDDVFLGPYVYVGHRAVIGSGVRLMGYVYVGDGVEVGDGSVIFPHVTLYSGVKIGKRVRIHSGTVVGSDGFGYVLGKEGAYKVPQRGGVVIGDDVEIGSNCSIDRGTLGDTVIGKGVKIDNLVQIAHNVRIGDGSIVVAQVGIAGSTSIGRGVIIAGQAGIAGHIKVGDGVRIGGQSGVSSSVPDGSTVSGTPHMDHRLWLKVSRLLRRLPELFSSVRSLEKRVRRLEGGSD